MFTKWLLVGLLLQSLQFQIWHLLQTRSSYRVQIHSKHVCDMIKTYSEILFSWKTPLFLLPQLNGTSLKFIRIMLETWNFVRKYKYICRFRKYTIYYQDLFNFVDTSIFFGKKLPFSVQNSTLTQNNIMRSAYVLVVFNFCKIKSYC